MKNIITINNLSKKYGNKLVLNELNMIIKEGDIVGILGENGCGKTTLLKILVGLLKKYKGSISLFDDLSYEEKKQEIAYLSDTPYYESWMKIKDLMNLYRSFYNNFDINICKEMLQKFQLDENLYIKQLSKGMKEKLYISLLLSRKARLLILDEPLAAVDPKARKIILDALILYKEPTQTILITTHLIQDIEKVFDYVIFMKNGVVVKEGDCEEFRLIYKKSIQDIFCQIMHLDSEIF